MLISVIIPVFNVKDYLEKCVDSVLDSNTDDCEIILVDDGSTDGESGPLCDIIAEKHPDIIRVIHQENKGLGGARNTGIKAAKGDYFLFIDSDDTVASGALNKLKDSIGATKADVVSFNMVTDDGNGNGASVKVNAYECDEPFTIVDHPEYIMSLPTACCRVWKRELFTETGIRFPNKVWYEDIRTTVKIFALAESIVTIGDELYVYYQREGSIMRTDNVDRNKEIIDAFEDIVSWFKENDLFERYKEVLTGLCIDNLYISASVRVLRVDPKHYLLKEFSSFIKENFPEYKMNSYIAGLSGTRKLVYKLLELKQYWLISLLFKLRGA